MCVRMPQKQIVYRRQKVAVCESAVPQEEVIKKIATNAKNTQRRFKKLNDL